MLVTIFYLDRLLAGPFLGNTMKFRPLLMILLAGCAVAAARNGSADGEGIKRTRYPALSPDGKTLAFGYQGDLWTVPASGGRAERLTSHLARDIQPVWSPDGKSVLFSSNRYGNNDLFLISADGGTPRRMTYHSASEAPASFSPDGKWILFYGTAYGSMDLYRMPASGGEPVRLTWDLFEREFYGNVSPDGQWIAYNHNASPGAWRRRGYEGSQNADIWLARFTAPVSEPKRITTNLGNDFAPLFSRDGKRLYYVSDRKGASGSPQVNLWSMDLAGGAQKQLTFHEADGVRIPSYAPKAEKIAYEYGSQIWLLDLKSGRSAPVAIEARPDDRRNTTVERTASSNPTEYTVSPDGKKIALILRGDLFVMPATGGQARPLITRSSRESHVTWMPDSKSVLFVTDVNGQKDLRTVEITGQNEKPLLGPNVETPEDETSPLVSPDGKLVAFHRGERALAVVPITGGAPVATIAGSFLDVSRGYSPEFSWSPDSKWLAFAQVGAQLDKAVYVASLADSQPKKVTRFFREAGTPRWSPDGKLIYFTGVAVDASNLYALDFTDEERPTFDEDALERLDQPGQPGPGPSGPPTVTLNFDGIERHLKRLTAAGGISDAILAGGGRLFIVDTATGIGTLPPNARDATPTPLVEGAGGVEVTSDGRAIFFLAAGQINSLFLPTRERRASPFTATLTINAQEENRQVFSEAWWLMDRYFYSDKLNSVDWKAVRTKYEALLPYVPYKDDFYDMMAEMVQELRGSHLGATAGTTDYTADTPSATGYLGIEPDWAVLDREGRIRVGRVTENSPAENKWSRLNVGDYILAVDGRLIDAEHPLDMLLDRKVGKKVVLSVNSTPSMDGARQVAIKPITQEAGDDLRYEEWVEARRRQVAQLSGGKVAYLHVREMNTPAELRFKDEFVGEATGKEALLVDVRYNGGGNIAHNLLDILRKKPYVYFQPRTLGRQVMIDWFGDYLWGKPAALLINHDSASNSEMMAEGFRALGIGPVVGTPTAGAVIATASWRFMDGGTIRMPATGVYSAAGEDLDTRGRQPDILVPYDPIASQQGRDPQLEAAIKAVLAKAEAGKK